MKKPNQSPAKPKSLREQIREAKELAKEEWCFIEKRKYNCSASEKPYLLDYELARESQMIGAKYFSAGIWSSVFPGHFPATPFLSIPIVERTDRLNEKFFGTDGAVPLFDPTAQFKGISYTFRYALTPEFQAGLEDIELEQKEDLAARDTPPDAAVDFLRNLPENAYDPSVANVEMTIRFDYSDEKLKDHFAEMLLMMRRTASLPGKKDELDAHLKRLAASRLYRILGTVAAAQSFLIGADFDLPYHDDSGWSRARQAILKLLQFQ